MNDSLIYLCNVPELDVNNNNSIDFLNLDKQYEFFISRIQREVFRSGTLSRRFPKERGSRKRLRNPHIAFGRPCAPSFIPGELPRRHICQCDNVLVGRR